MILSELLGDAWKEGMTLEEVNDALKDISLPEDRSAEIEKLRKSLTDSNSEAADWKRKFRETQDAEKRKADEEAENVRKLQEELESLRRENTIAGYKNSYLGMGYSEKDAQEVANALADGNVKTVLEIQKRHQETLTEKIRKELLKDTHRPGGGGNEDDGDSAEKANVKLAQEMAKANTEGAKQFESVMSHYLK